MDIPSPATAGPETRWGFDDAGLDALMLDLELLTALVFGPVRLVGSERAA